MDYLIFFKQGGLEVYWLKRTEQWREAFSPGDILIEGSPRGIMLRGTEEAQFLSQEYILKQVDLQELEWEEREKR